MIYLKEIINQYMNEAKDEFIKAYINELDNNILKMVTYFGFENENLDNLNEWLIDKNYDLLMDNEEREGNSYKSIYLLNKQLNSIIGLFMVETFINEGDVGYRFSDIFIKESID